MVWQLLRKLVYTILLSNNRLSFPLWGKENLIYDQQVWKYYENDCLQYFLLLFMSLLPTRFVKKSHIWRKIYCIFLKNVRKQTWNSFKTKFQDKCKAWKSSYQVKEILAVFCYLIPLILGQSSMESLRFTKIVKESRFERARGELESKRSFQKQ